MTAASKTSKSHWKQLRIGRVLRPGQQEDDEEQDEVGGDMVTS